MKLDEFLGLFGGLEEAEFKTRFSHPFLLEKLELLADPSARRVVLIRGSKGNPLAIGRGARCHLPIRDRLVSTKHAELLPPQSDEQPWKLVDAGSTNGTFLAGTQLEPNVPATLSDGAAVSFGPETNFEFLLRDSFWARLKALKAATPAARVADPDEATHGLDATLQAGALRVPAAAPPVNLAEVQDKPTHKRFKVDADPHRKGAEMLLVCGELDPVPLEMDATLAIGRKAENADVVLVDGRISRRHAEVRRSKEGLFIRDLGSSNGTYVAGREVGPDWEPLQLGQVITIGPFDLYVGSPQSHGTDRWGEGNTVDIKPKG
jgi:pSer/pThr/pTyr-binding forkhead associated (FHA) protein